ncbi:MAG TPA: AraC family transcriptional regulator [Verrucomicrobiae bacterium]|nr:AraC family transcriptional regulator [Verrucomicrobiae bacterium]
MSKSTDATETNPDFFSTQVSQARRFFLNPTARSKTGMVVVCGGMEHCAPDYAIHRRSFPFYSIEYVIRGIGRLQFGRSEHRLQPGSVFAYGPGIPHKIFTDPNQPLTKYFVDFSGTDATGLLQTARLRPGAVARIFPPMEIQPLFDELIRNGLRGTRQSPQICAMLLEVLSRKISEARAPLPGRETLAFESYRHCRAHIERHFLRLRSVEQIAAECHMDDTYLCRLFKRYDHETPYRFLVRLKMNHAAERLRAPATLIKQVAEEIGFANPFHFSRTFKSVFGIPPSALSKIR